MRDMDLDLDLGVGLLFLFFLLLRGGGGGVVVGIPSSSPSSSEVAAPARWLLLLLSWVFLLFLRALGFLLFPSTDPRASALICRRREFTCVCFSDRVVVVVVVIVSLLPLFLLVVVTPPEDDVFEASRFCLGGDEARASRFTGEREVSSLFTGD